MNSKVKPVSLDGFFDIGKGQMTLIGGPCAENVH